ncbi:saccharopine dehydrogenase family protein [Mycobacterium montefiorense]|uniref:Trans-acting enoyl reductase n=1 Tax=Mycobacterium montefiorense TaxID=154654 RepID=A0AA37UWA9_9MYCO|nr:saccharopine dehydrogenase NADP-binding domain-containing protein [Mycobacterium montefiorense]GBG36396.1 trans-acting enoyl reductase [Mycobacterium montefiorense]GKU37135.1 trans-acting enoyl reductase [Mycobacterium montefiorense]GKU43349.1 trans-acting enoyl reductase [Mycobacterium montefiorense]GKU43917.1 trans-acting enoyl reductase [Mycobacterium montefiorense]GKU53676.1 trans-acting enoyl reductase [Mycobacterium montefiorense]
MSSAEREFDIMVYGATGYSGKLTAQYLARVAGDARIALAGRSRERLLAARESLGRSAHDWPLIVADAAQPAPVQDMAARARVVVTTVGPYTTYGLPVVAACAKAGTDYVDLTGEVMFVRNSIDRYHEQAVDTGARIVVSCGFASIPSDLNVYQLYRRARGDGAGELCDTTLVFRSFFQGGGSGGTVASEFESMRTASSDPEARHQMDDPYTLTPDRGAEPDLGPQHDFAWRRGSRIAPELAGFWLGGLMWAPHNTRVVRRSNALQNWPYGRRFRYSETMSLGKSFAAPVASGVVTGTLAGAFALGTRHFRRVPQRWLAPLARPGTGPGEKMRERGHYTAQTYTTTTSGARYLGTFAQQLDAYSGTGVLLAECGLALAFDRGRLSDLRGVLTPAAAMGDALLTRLPAAGVSMNTVRLS